ncbi:MAG: hypothetical protein JWN73_3592 [Betaproteobacteria bacterium]|nr:hypothetical protein [Betaproteobacteria bacterium]
MREAAENAQGQLQPLPPAPQLQPLPRWWLAELCLHVAIFALPFVVICLR